MSEEFSLKEINRVKDSSALTVMEKKHLPVILESPDTVEKGMAFIMKVKVGGLDGVEHPNVVGHWINWIELYVGDLPVAKTEFMPVYSNGYVITFSLVLEESALVKLVDYCNLHGVWEGDESTGGAKKITVK